jgi:hypothetical protein
VVTKAVFYLGHLFRVLQTGGQVTNYLEDYPNCGVRNNDTFRWNPSASSYDTAQYGNQATADWSVECLWDCQWKESPFIGNAYIIQYPDFQITFNLSMPKIPVDLRCLDNCTDVQSTSFRNDPVCNSSTLGSFLGCYIYYDQYYGSNKNYFYLAAETCILSLVEPKAYPAGNCKDLGVNLRIFSPFNPPTYLYNSYLSNSRLQGPATEEVVAFAGIIGAQVPTKNRHPWLCSLRTPGYRGVHRCGVTLLSGPPRPTIFVSAAHCNYLCKNGLDRVVEVCCCRDAQSEFSCTSSPFCGTGSTLQLASPSDLQIVCNIPSQEALPQGIGYPDATVFDIKEIINHPNYKPPVKGGSLTGGPIDGYDISVYIVNDANFTTMNTSFIWPACLPKADDAYYPGSRGILVGWNEPLPTYLDSYNFLQTYVNQNLIVREALYEGQSVCSDPAWMKSNTYYPPGTLCYTDAAWASVVQFGTSGSGLVRPFLSVNANETRYSWIGPLSFSKGSDCSRLVYNWRGIYSGLSIYTRQVINYSSTPAVFTDARCYLDWIAAQYGLTLPASYSKPASCSLSAGDKLAANNTNCLSRDIEVHTTSNVTTRCQFKPGVSEKCKLFAYDPNAKPPYNSNFYYCNNTAGNAAACANDCPGMDPNSVVVGGEAAVLSLAVATAAAGPELLGPVLWTGVSLAGLGLGGYAMSRGRTCPPNQCRAQQSQRCCNLVVNRGQRLCPLTC